MVFLQMINAAPAKAHPYADEADWLVVVSETILSQLVSQQPHSPESVRDVRRDIGAAFRRLCRIASNSRPL